jgi:integrase
MIVPITKQVGKEGKTQVAVLTPNQWHLLESHLNADYKIRGNFLLQTAMRIAEAIYVSRHPECFRKENGAIYLPFVTGKEKIGKLRCKQKTRTILLSPKGVKAVQDLFDNNVKFPSYQAMEGSFKRAAKEADIDNRYIRSKSFRKSFISWLMVSMPDKQMSIAKSAGHDFDTMQRHYVEFAFRKEDIKDMKEETDGWGEPV